MNWFRRIFGHGSSGDDADALPSSPRAISPAPATPAASKSPRTLHQQIAILEQCGIRLRPGVTVEHLLKAREGEWIDDSMRKNPFLNAVLDLGGELDNELGGRVSDDLWHFDTECIEDNGDYVQIAERARDLARGELPLTNITDEIDVENDRASLEFDLDGKHIRWKLKVQDDWVDDKLFKRFAELLAARKATRKLTYLDLGGQDCIIGCATPQELAKLRQLTGLRWRWMT